MKIINNKYRLSIAAISSGLLLSLAWPPLPTGILLMVAFLPLLLINETLIEQNIPKSGSRFFLYSYLSFIIWNVLSTWWVYNSTAIGGAFAMAANALLMTIPMILFHHTRKRTNIVIGNFSFLVYWISFEYIHLNWSLSWPWLTLGNAFAATPSLVQWYEYTGVFGGTLWVLLANLLFLFIIKKRNVLVNTAALSIWVIVPLVLSILIYNNYKEKGELAEIVVVQPNIDPYEEKFPGTSNFIPYQEQFDRLINLSKQEISDKTQFVLWPETAIPSGYLEKELESYDLIKRMQAFVREMKQGVLITGLDSYQIYDAPVSPTASYDENAGYYDSYNSALLISPDTLDIYHKSKLVPGVETVPSFLSFLTIDMGGTSGSLGTQETRSVFFNKNNIGAAPVICYESIFGEFMTDYVRNGAGFIAIITNDGWWGNTPGHVQHLQYASLRAIETRKSVARSANTGISGFINQRGDIRNTTEYWKTDVRKDNIYVNDYITFYVMAGDFIGLVGVYMSGIFILVLVYLLLRKNKTIQKEVPVSI